MSAKRLIGELRKQLNLFKIKRLAQTWKEKQDDLNFKFWEIIEDSW